MVFRGGRRWLIASFQGKMGSVNLLGVVFLSLAFLFPAKREGSREVGKGKKGRNRVVDRKESKKIGTTWKGKRDEKREKK